MSLYLSDTSVSGGLDVAEIADVAHGGSGRAVLLLPWVEVCAGGRAAVCVVTKLVHMETMFTLKCVQIIKHNFGLNHGCMSYQMTPERQLRNKVGS